MDLLFIFQCTFISTLQYLSHLDISSKRWYQEVDLLKSDKYLLHANGAVAQLARAPALQAGGQEFDSP